VTGLYAAGTTVTPERTQSEIIAVLKKYGASGFAFGQEEDGGMVMFRANERIVRFILPLPTNWQDFRRHGNGMRDRAGAEKALAAEVRRRWRALLLGIKSKLEVVASGIVSFEEEFAVHIVLPDGSRVGEHLLPAIAESYETGEIPALLPGMTRKAIER